MQDPSYKGARTHDFDDKELVLECNDFPQEALKSGLDECNHLNQDVSSMK